MRPEHWNSPLLHQLIYLEDAIHETLSWYRLTYQTVCAMIAEPRGWRLTLTDTGVFRGTGATLLHEMMNAILVRSLETRLTGMVR